MAAVVEFCACRLAGRRLVKREKEHAPLGAEAFLLTRRMPTRAEAFGREDNQGTARTGDGVSAGLFKRAHEGRNARSAWPDALGFREERVPFVRAFRRCAMPLERHEDGQAQKCVVAVGEPPAVEKRDFAHAPEILRVGAAFPGARGIFANVAAKGGELSHFLDNPIVPVVL